MGVSFTAFESDGPFRVEQWIHDEIAVVVICNNSMRVSLQTESPESIIKLGELIAEFGRKMRGQWAMAEGEAALKLAICVEDPTLPPNVLVAPPKGDYDELMPDKMPPFVDHNEEFEATIKPHIPF